jgi:putative MATE family efflux protein
MSLQRQVAVLAIWPLLEQVLAFSVGMTDLTIAGRMVGGVDRVAVLDALGLGGYVAWFFNILQGAVATGVMALVARAVGGRDRKLAHRGLGQGVWLGFAAGCLSWLMLVVGLGALIDWIGLGPLASDKVEVYLQILARSGPFSGILFAVNAALRGAGDTRTPFVSMLVVNGVNIVASVTLVFGPGHFGGHGIAGIAWGTFIGWGAGLVAVAWMLGRRGRADEESLSWRDAAFGPDFDTMKRILRVGAPQALEIAGMWGIHALGVRIIAHLPQKGVLGAHILAIRIESMSFLPGFAIGTAAAALAGQYLGAGSPNQAVRAVRVAWRWSVVLMTSIGLVILYWRRELIGLLAPGSELHLQLAAPLLVVTAFTQPLFATCIVMKTSMRGAGATRMVMTRSFASMLVFRVLVLWWAVANLGIGLTGVWIIFGCDMLVQSIMFTWLHFRGTWLGVSV